MTSRITLFALIICLSTSVATAAPFTLRQQGVAFDAAGSPLTGTFTLAFRLFDAQTGGNQLWEEVFVGQPLDRGLFDVVLGQKLPLGPELFRDNDNVFLELQIEGEAPLPRSPVTSVPAALTAVNADIASHLECSGCVDATVIADGSITSAKLGFDCEIGQHLQMTDEGWACATLSAPTNAPVVETDPVATDLLCSGCVAQTAIADAAITTSKIADESITSDKLAMQCANGQILERQLVGSKVVWTCGEDDVNPGTVTQIAAGDGLTGGVITGAGTLAIKPFGVTGGHIANNAVTTSKLADGAVTAAKIAFESITGDRIADGAITKDKLASDVGIDCNWDGERYLSYGWDGGCAFQTGANLTCQNGKITKISYKQGC